MAFLFDVFGPRSNAQLGKHAGAIHTFSFNYFFLVHVIGRLVSVQQCVELTNILKPIRNVTFPTIVVKR